MSYVSMNELLRTAEKGGYAVGAFNILNQLTARAVVEECEAQSAPVILQTSVGTVKQIGVDEMIDFLAPLARRAKVPVAVHLDHCTDPALARRCIDAGWSSIMIDASKQPLEENIAITKGIVDYINGRDISVEGELGAIVGVEDNVAVAADDGRLADVESSITYTKATGVDAFAPAIGTAHGLYHGEPNVDFERFAQIKAAVSTPLVVHGGTGLSDEAFRRLVELGAAKINISTAIKIAYLSAVRAFAADCPGEGNPLKLDAKITAEVRAITARHIQLFGATGKA